MSNLESITTPVDALTRYFVGDATMGDTLTRVAELSTEAVPPAKYVGITLLIEGRMGTYVLTHPEIPEIDRAQYDTGDGPCVGAYRTGEVTVIVSALATDRWTRCRASRRQRSRLRRRRKLGRRHRRDRHPGRRRWLRFQLQRGRRVRRLRCRRPPPRRRPLRLRPRPLGLDHRRGRRRRRCRLHCRHGWLRRRGLWRLRVRPLRRQHGRQRSGPRPPRQRQQPDVGGFLTGLATDVAAMAAGERLGDHRSVIGRGVGQAPGLFNDTVLR